LQSKVLYPRIAEELQNFVPLLDVMQRQAPLASLPQSPSTPHI
jgi:hypothetical protein